MTGSEYVEVEPQSVDLSILERFTEADVARWMIARMCKMRASGVPVSTIDLRAHYRSYGTSLASSNNEHYDYVFNGHALDVCVLTVGSTDRLEAELRNLVSGDTRGRAEKKRLEAKRLLEEAAELEKVNIQPEAVSG
jgi:hypothetical protein